MKKTRARSMIPEGWIAKPTRKLMRFVPGWSASRYLTASLASTAFEYPQQLIKLDPSGR